MKIIKIFTNKSANSQSESAFFDIDPKLSICKQSTVKEIKYQAGMVFGQVFVSVFRV